MSRHRPVAGLWLALAALVLTAAGCGGDGAEDDKDPFTAVEQRPQGVRSAGKAAPRWERVATLAGTRNRTENLEIARGAIQWRTRWRCSSGRLALSLSPPPRSGRARSEHRCPDSGTTSWLQTGQVKLNVSARRRWSVAVDQQVDTPLREPPAPAMQSRAASVLTRGRFYGIERRGMGSALLYRLPGGRLALRFENFSTAANTDLYVWVSQARRPKTTKQAFRSRHVEIAALKSTSGDQNYLLPRRINPDGIRSIVIWCEPVQIAYAAATL